MFTPFFKIKTVDEARREVGGLITSETVDKDQETLDYSGSKPHFQAWSDEAYNSTKSAGQAPSYGNLREQHGKRMAGKFSEPLRFDDTAKTIHGTAKIYDDDIWQKIVDGAYTGFSVGGSLAAPVKKVGNQKFITIVPREVSLVDNPAVTDAHFDFIRAADGQVVKMSFKMSDPKYRLKSAVSELLNAVKFLAPELAPTAEEINAPGAIEPVPVPPQDGAEVASHDLAYAPDAVPDGSKPEATDPVGEQVHESAKARKYDATPALTVGAPDTQSGKHDSEPKAEMIGLDGANKVADAVQKHDKIDEPATMGTAVTPDPKIETDPIGHVAEDFGQKADEDPNAFHDETSIEKVSPPGWKGTVDAMQDHSEITNPYALAWWMDGEGYTAHKLSKAAACEFVALWKAATVSMCDCVKSADGQDYAIHSGVKVSRENHAYAPAGSSPSEWKYPIQDAAHVRNALARWGQHKGIPADQEAGVYAKIKHAAKKFGIEVSEPDAKEAAKVAEKQISKLSTGANQMANEVEKAARKSLHDHLAALKSAASSHAGEMNCTSCTKHAAAVSDLVDKCQKLAGEPAFDADSEREGGQPATGDAEGATDTEVKGAKSGVEKLSGLIEKLTVKVDALEKAAAPKAEEKETEKASKSETVVGDRSKAAPVKAEVTVEKLSADAKENEELLKLYKAANGIKTTFAEVDGKIVEKTERIAPDLAARDALYNKVTNAKAYMAAGQVARRPMR